ncbi:LysR substrate-binding domain-containing protein [Limnobaculum parvum]|uniref:LysR family transcriptional regulator n=1 Tax=Limnobaculum parvum TaxID=2172103 RepID=A0A2Y9TXH7_9GAMM|nr:LysR substrate-binding domain-containing protein [Limnobaculum parvum]AWH88251.1 LysR family transcriptional regulator [Limnobaculum parvum]
MSVKMNHLKAFKEVAERGSIRSASRSMGISQPALTRNIKDLENQMGVSLIERNSNGITLTVYGEYFLNHAKLILKELELAQDGIRQQLEKFNGSVSIGMGGSVALSILPEVAAWFRKDYPEAKMYIYEEQVDALLNSLRNGELDFCINTANPEMHNGEFDFEALFTLDYAIFVRQDHPLAGVASLNELKDQSWILPITRSGYHQKVLDMLTENGLNPEVSFYINNVSGAVELLKKTDCFSILSHDLNQSDRNDHGIVPLNIDLSLPPATYYIVCRKSSPLLPLAQKLIHFFRLECNARTRKRASVRQ